MTTAGRATWTAAKGSKNRGGRLAVMSQQISAKALPGHLTLKLREQQTPTAKDLQKQHLRLELERREKEHLKLKGKENILLEGDKDEHSEQYVQLQDLGKNIDADDSFSSESDSDSDPDSESSVGSDEDSDTSETEELMRELERIKKEREEEKEKNEKLHQALQSDKAEDKTSNPLLNIDEKGDFLIKKRWYEDTIFRNQAKYEPKTKKRFINDTVRNDFHRKFLDKYIQ